MPVTNKKCDREFTKGRQEQGFTAESLIAFADYYDHTQSCSECGSGLCGMYLDDGFQPGMSLCSEAIRLFR